MLTKRSNFNVKLFSNCAQVKEIFFNVLCTVLHSSTADIRIMHTGLDPTESGFCDC